MHDNITELKIYRDYKSQFWFSTLGLSPQSMKAIKIAHNEERNPLK